MFEEYLQKKVLIIEPNGEQSIGVLEKIFYDFQQQPVSIKLKTHKSDIIIHLPFKLKFELNGGEYR
jgi:hypothetical protein